MATTQYDFSDRKVLITGGSSGIGLGIATMFADAGAQVTVTGRKASAADYDTDLSRFAYLPAEMTNREALLELASDFTDLDVLVNNAGSNLIAQDEWKPDTSASPSSCTW